MLFRLVALIAVAGLALGGPSTGIAVGQSSGFGCDDFLTREAAQTQLDMDPTDPYSLDADGNGIACDEPGAQVALEREIAEVTPLPLDARLGGTLDSWQAKFGLPVEQEGEHADLFTAYAIPDFSTVYADDYLGRIERITLFSPRPEGEEWTDDPHEMNWSVEDAHAIAEGFLPRDAHLEETVRGEYSDLDLVLCTSDALAAEVPQEIYDYVDNSPQYGRCSYSLLHEDGGDGDRISWIIISLEIEEPLDAAEMAATVAASEGQAPTVDLP